MEDCWTSLYRYLPPQTAQEMMRLSQAERESVQEVRLRAEAAVMLSMPCKNRLLQTRVTALQVQECFYRLCDHAVHTHQEEVRQGFITTREGFRVGVAGTAVVRDTDVTAYRAVSSLCIRLPRHIVGCASPLLPFIEQNGRLNSVLVCGAPAVGKTTVLRDAAEQLSWQYRVAVVDERQELSYSGLNGCDVLRGCPKKIGILQAVRTLSPDAVVIDELGDDSEWHAVAESLFCGVAVIASVHASQEEDLMVRRVVREVLTNGGFTWLVFLPPRGCIGQPFRMRKVADWIENSGNCSDRLRLCGSGSGRGISAF